MTNEVYFMVPSGTGPEPKYEPYLMVPSTGVEPEVYYMNPTGQPEPPEVPNPWEYIGVFNCPMSSGTATFTFEPGDYTNGYKLYSLPSYTRLRIKYKSGAIYYGAVSGIYRAGCGWKTQIDFGSCSNAPGPDGAANAAQAAIEAQGMTIEIEMGGDGYLYNGILLTPPRADRSGEVFFDIWGMRI
jgi:hypothetical protein